APLETALTALGVPVAFAARPRLPQTAFGRALLGLLRFAWLGGGRRELYGFLRTPYSGVPRTKVDFLEGRLRGRAINAHDRVEAETLALHGAEFPIVKELREADSPLAGLAAVASRMLRHAYGLNAPPTDDDARRALAHARLLKPAHVARDRYLLYTACTRATARLYLVREAATDDGMPVAPSPFWDEVVRLFPKEAVERATTRRALSALTWPLDAAPSERERLRALALFAAEDEREAEALAYANGWERRLERALRAFSRPTKLTHPLVLDQLRERATFNVTELERMSDCSSAWFVERFLSPRTIDADVDAKLRGSVAHSALSKFFSGIPKHLGIERLDAAHL